MAKSALDVPATRLPRGTKPVAQAFLTTLDTIPEGSRSAVAKSALSIIRDELKSRREKTKVVGAKRKVSKPPVAKSTVERKIKAKVKHPASARRARKSAEAPAEG